MKQKAQGDKANDKKKNPKGKNKPEEEEEKKEEVPKEKEKNLERFIYVTTYQDSDFMKKLKGVFEEINQPAFNLRSVKEIYTRNLSEEEQDNNTIDYISGYQLIDKDIRITMLEGITGKGMKIVKERLPKYQMNNDKYKVFSDAAVLFNKRIYSKFDLCLKYIKLRDTLNHILLTFDIYSKANKYRDIYNAFLNCGAILKASTMKEIANANLFSDANALLLLERKYADILTDEDLTGVHIMKKPKKDKASALNSSLYSQISDSSRILDKNEAEKSFQQKQSEPDEQKDQKEVKTKLESHNFEYDQSIKSRKKETIAQTLKKNSDFIKTMNKKPIDPHFCRPLSCNPIGQEIYLYSQQTKNHYAELVRNMRDKYIQDKDNFYSYSQYGLALSFPLGPQGNPEYIEYINNKKKWKDTKDFDRYKQFSFISTGGANKEYVYLPKINNEL